jgi:phosphate-selective porin OprO and OprP
MWGLRKLRSYLLLGTAAVGIACGTTSPATAQDLQQLQAEIEAMRAEMKALRKEVQDARAQASAATSAAAEAGGKSDLDLKVKWKGAPELSSADGKFKMKVRGRVEVDYNKANQNTRITSFPDVSGTELRRARLGVEGVIYYDWKYLFEFDLANDAVRVRDAYLEYQGFKISEDPLLLRVGNFKTFNTFEEETSANYLDTMERAAFISAWNIDRQIGFGTMYYADHFGLAGGVFGQRFPATQDNPLFPGFTGDEDLTFAARAYATPINRETNGVTQVLHFGASARNRQAGDDQPLFNYGNETGNATRAAELRLTDEPVQTGRTAKKIPFGVSKPRLCGDPLRCKVSMRSLRLICPAAPSFAIIPQGRVSLGPLPTRSSAIPIQPSMPGIWREAGSLAVIRPMKKVASGAVQRSTTRCSTAVAAGVLCSWSANTTCSTRVT